MPERLFVKLTGQQRGLKPQALMASSGLCEWGAMRVMPNCERLLELQ